METFLLTYFGEILVGSVLLTLSWAFRSWSNSIKKSTDTILDKLEYLTKEFHAHRIEVERRITKVETEAKYHKFAERD